MKRFVANIAITLWIWLVYYYLIYPVTVLVFYYIILGKKD